MEKKVVTDYEMSDALKKLQSKIYAGGGGGGGSGGCKCANSYTTSSGPNPVCCCSGSRTFVARF